LRRASDGCNWSVNAISIYFYSLSVNVSQLLYTKGVHEARQQARGVKFLKPYDPNEPYDPFREAQILKDLGKYKTIDPKTQILTDRAQQAVNKGNFESALADLREAEILRPDLPGIRDIRLQTEGAYEGLLETN